MKKYNYFSTKMAEKTDKHLLDVLSDAKYLDEAKQAAVWELEKRGICVEFEPVEEKRKEKPFRIPLMKESKRWKRFHERRLLIFGISCLAMAIYFFVPDLLTTKSSLAPLEGTIESAQYYVENVSSRNRIGYETKSKRAKLVFNLIEYQKKFELFENIGSENEHKKFRNLSNRLNKSKQATIWIRRSELDKWEPKVFQIDINGRTELEFNEVRTKNGYIFIFLFFMGTGSILLLMWRKYPERTNNVYRNIMKPTAKPAKK